MPKRSKGKNLTQRKGKDCRGNPTSKLHSSFPGVQLTSKDTATAAAPAAAVAVVNNRDECMEIDFQESPIQNAPVVETSNSQYAITVDQSTISCRQTIDLLNVAGENIPHTVIAIQGDGACLFRAISYHIYGTQDAHLTVRKNIVEYIFNHWNEHFKVMSYDEFGDNYVNAAAYKADMIKPNIYGGTCELFAAGLIYDFIFQVFHNRELLQSFGSRGTIKRLKFIRGQNMSTGHFEVYIPVINQPTTIMPMDVSENTTRAIVDIVENNINPNNTEINEEEQNRIEMNRLTHPRYLRAADKTFAEEPSYLGRMTNQCRYCNALYFNCETNKKNIYTHCCNDGKVSLPALQEMPMLLRGLFGGAHSLSKHFKQSILQYNSAFQFASFEAKLAELPPTIRAPPIYKIQGKVYHHVSDVNVNNQQPRFGPIYFLQPDQATNQRVANNRQLNLQLIQTLEVLLRNVNPYAIAYMNLHQRYNLEVETIERLRINANANNMPLPMEIPHIELEFLKHNERRYDRPDVDEVAAIYPFNPAQNQNTNLKICTAANPTQFKNINMQSELIDPLVFPLLFPYGEPGWHSNIPLQGGNQRTRVTLCDFYAYRLAYRDSERRFASAGRLNQQFVVSAYVKIEHNRLEYIKNNQEKLRRDEFVHLADFLNRRANEDDEAYNLGTMTILPSTFIGSVRSQQQLFQDAMAVVAKYGAPSLFITMTCNPTWPEITLNMPQGDLANNHPMLLTRVFQYKLNELIDEILKNHIFGTPMALLYVVEFQKRGLPHAHILLILKEQDRLYDAVRIDTLISAEIPNETTDPELYRSVTNHMIHRPCVGYNDAAPCIKDDKCSKKFPKDFHLHTTIDAHGKVLYRRRNDNKTIDFTLPNRTVVQLDNRWIVPHNPYLLLKYNAHINVEACISNKSVKYLYKYFFKGMDSALVRITLTERNYNEIHSYLNCRYMSPVEASWHINKYVLHKNTHTVERLHVHLPERQFINFVPGRERETLQKNQRTKLTEWFTLNQNDVDANQYLYSEIPLHYTWNNSLKRWQKRKLRGEYIVTRMYGVNVRDRELFYLRILLLHQRGARSYEDVRTVNGTTFDTFKEACQELNLLADDTEWRKTLSEATIRHLPYQLREMFAYILLFTDAVDRLSLWDQFTDDLIDDFIRQNIPRDEAIRRTLQHIQKIFQNNGTTLNFMGLPEPVDINRDIDEVIDLVAERHRGQQSINQLNVQQRNIFDSIINAINNPNNNKLFFIDAAAGCGKSFLFQTLITYLRGENVPHIVLAPTGMAASLLQNCRTLHGLFKLPFDINETTTIGLTPLSRAGRTVAEAKVLILDEVSMISASIFNIIERGIRDLCNDNRRFANKIVVLGGDFRQTLPIVIGGDVSTILNTCIKRSLCWHEFQKHQLHLNMRTGVNEPEYAEWLLHIGNDTVPNLKKMYNGNVIRLPQESIVGSKMDLITFCFSNIANDTVFDKVILTPFNEYSHEINDLVLQKLPQTSRTYYSSDSTEKTDNDLDLLLANFSSEFLNSLTPNGFPLHKLTLKVGCIVILLRNLNISQNLSNGTRLIVKLLGERYIEAETLDSSSRPSGRTVFIPRIDLVTSQLLPFTLKRRQFPLRLAYAMTINKAQGQTFGKIGLHLPKPVFSHGQLYVALSRIQSAKNLRIFVESTPSQGQLAPNSKNVYTLNVVYREIL